MSTTCGGTFQVKRKGEGAEATVTIYIERDGGVSLELTMRAPEWSKALATGQPQAVIDCLLNGQ